MRYYKLTTEEKNHNDYEYKLGLNENKDGLYFTDEHNWTRWIEYDDKIMYWIWDCNPIGEILDFNGKYKAPGIVLSNPRCIFNTPDLVKTLINKCGWALKYIKNPSEEIQLEYVEKFGWGIKYISNPSEKVQKKAIKSSSWAIQNIINPSDKIKLFAIKEKKVRGIKIT